MRAYIVLSLHGRPNGGAEGALVAARRAFDEDRQAWCPVDEVGWDQTQFAVYVWRSVRKTGDTKTVKSRRSLRLPDRCVVVLKALKIEQDHGTAGAIRNGKRLVFSTRTGTALSAGNVRRDFRAVLNRAGLVAKEWTPLEHGTASCRCSPPMTSRSRTSPGWSATPTPW